MGNIDVSHQKSFKSPAWAWKGVAPETSMPAQLANSPIANLAARLAAIRVGHAPMHAPVVSNNADAAQTADISASLARELGEDNKENVGVFGRQGWRELSFEERLKGAAKSKAEVTSAAVQTVQGLQQGLENLKGSPGRRVSGDGLPSNAEAAEAKAGTIPQERLNAGKSKGVSGETEAKGRWTRMWTQIPEEGQLADANGTRHAVPESAAGGQEKGIRRAMSVGSGKRKLYCCLCRVHDI